MKARNAVLAAAIGSIAFTAASKAATLAAWTFENDAVGVNNSPAPSTPTGTASSIGMNIYPTPNVGVTADDVLLGVAKDTGANAIADLTNIWRIRGQAGANGAANGWSSQAPIGTQGAVFATNPVGNGSVSITFDWYSTTQGDANLELAWSTDGGTTLHNVPITVPAVDTAGGLQSLTNSSSPNTVTGSYVSDNLLTAGTGNKAGQDWFTGLSGTVTDASALSNPNFAFYLVNASTGADCVSTQGTALNNTSGNWRFDNISIAGTPTPEPASLGLLSLGGLAALRRRRA